MGDKTGIEWTDATWNALRGCTRVSEGCRNCYAETVAARFSDPGQPYHGIADRSRSGSKWTGKVSLVEKALDLPLRWKKPRRVFVNSMSDLFHESVPDEWIDNVFIVMALAPQHTFQIVTKRPKRMHDYAWCLEEETPRATARRIADAWPGNHPLPREIVFPLPNAWFGVSVEDQETADERVPILLDTPAAVRFVSAEPLLGPLRMPGLYPVGEDGVIDIPALDWVIVGGESGPGARPCWTPNVRSIVRQCHRAGVPVFVKQMGSNVEDRNDAGFDGCDRVAWPDVDPDDIEEHVDGYQTDYQGAPVRIRLRDRKGGDMKEWPEDLRVRQLPEGKR